MSICNPQHTCAADGCEFHIHVARFMCGVHWKALSQTHRTAVNIAYADWLSLKNLQRVNRLRHAQKQAIESLLDHRSLI